MFTNKKFYILFVIALSFIVSIAVSGKATHSGKVLKIDGKYAFIKIGKKWKRLKKYSKIYNQAEIKTGKKTRLIIKFNDNSELRIAERSRIKLEKAYVKSPEKRQISARLFLGKLWAKVAKSKNKNKNFTVKTMNATAGVRGTTFSVNVEEKTSIVSLYTGSVEVKSKKQKDKKVDMRNYDKRKRKEIAGPKEVSLNEWNQIVLKQMQRVKVSDGHFELLEMLKEVEAKDEWVAWNTELDNELNEK